MKLTMTASAFIDSLSKAFRPSALAINFALGLAAFSNSSPANESSGLLLINLTIHDACEVSSRDTHGFVEISHSGCVGQSSFRMDVDELTKDDASRILGQAEPGHKAEIVTLYSVGRVNLSAFAQDA